MSDIDLGQRVEEIEHALSNLFDSPKNPAVSSYDEESAFYIQVSWVVESHRDTTLDSRCVVTIRFTPAQIQRYAQTDTAKRLVIRERLCDKVREQVSAQQSAPSTSDDCATEFTVDDALLDVTDPPY
ncbi:DUF3022 domain-containing protein [Paraburkholderia sp. DHOC27]|uniref:DUF3022 domain-containing protein n=1 Tax=Paraburkholderia sp. DHOC27 TaxID=2303330 RepID=UPI000E3B6D85|nr:DUF3022 domain-containing protein [Paraburkholderia sp. DHOC27]RFU48446.1 DUF3022 domain-containing protein [Paraburkholderia sp. DHOC27]